MKLILILLISLCLYIFQKIILLFQFKIAKKGFDHFFHFSIINNIKENKNKILEITPFRLSEINFAYPQLFHWILSFFPKKFIAGKYIRIGQAINFITLVSFVIFAFTIYDFLQLSISRELFIFYSGLAFTLSPFNYLLWNAKNRGLSVRGFGLLLGYLYLFCIVWLYLYDNVWFYIPVFAICLIILLSSQFAFQFILLVTPFLAVFYKDLILVFPPIIAVILYLFFFRKIAIQFFKGQYYHKKNWFKYLAKVEILKQRHSIYRDFFYDFWKKKDIKYILNNPIIAIFFGFPFLSGLITFILIDILNISTILENRAFYVLLIPIISALAAFVITSFRLTRFFGEPERYIEFSLPFFSVLSVVYLQNFEWIIVILICFSFVYIMYQYSLFGFQVKVSESSKIKKIKNYITTNHPTNQYKVFSNNVALLNFFIDNEKFKILFPNITSEHTGQFHFKEIYPETFLKVNPEVVLPLIEEFKIDWFILHPYWLSENDLITEYNNIKLEKKTVVDQLVLYKVEYTKR